MGVKVKMGIVWRSWVLSVMPNAILYVQSTGAAQEIQRMPGRARIMNAENKRD